jgi:hypothetical protein
LARKLILKVIDSSLASEEIDFVNQLVLMKSNEKKETREIEPIDALEIIYSFALD